MIDIQQIRDECGKDIILLGKTISPEVYNKPTPKFHYELTPMLSNLDIRQGSAEAPRGTAKTTLCKGEVLRHCLYDEGDKVVVIQSKTRREAVRRLTSIKNTLEYNKTFHELYGYLGAEVADTWREDEIRVKTPYGYWVILSIGTGQQARGILEDYTRITLYYLDDPQDETNCITMEQMDKDFDKFLGNIAGLDMIKGRVRVIGTPIRAGCIIERIRNTPGWVTLHFKNHQEDGTILWPEMYSEQWLDDKKAELKSFGKISKYYSEYECEIVGDEDQLFKPEYMRYWDGDFIVRHGEAFLKINWLDGKDVEPYIVPINTFQGNDPASSTKQTADFSVRFTTGYDIDKKLYCLPYFRERVNPMQHADEIIRSIKEEVPKRGHIETVGYQEMLRQYVKERLREEKLSLAGLETKFNPRTEKSARLEVLQPLFAQKRVFLKRGMDEFENELFAYPRGKHDDLIDGFYYSTRRLFQPHHVWQNEPEYTDDEAMHVNRHGQLKLVKSYLAA